MELAILKNNKYIVAYLIKYGSIPNAKEMKTAINNENEVIIEMVRTGKHLNIIKEYELNKGVV
ncbi:hypothetical protein [Rossellomorea aquimaris]|uniref:hypothetical protein n=1 Tax=Rossellomorea aquimaris TaxID=189382 RepID=UPI0007D088BD|nr:hypothetical protein [Rossellomorea aquimaris]